MAVERCHIMINTCNLFYDYILLNFNPQNNNYTFLTHEESILT